MLFTGLASEMKVWSCRHVYRLQSCRNQAMASSGERAQSHGSARKRFKGIPLAVTCCACPCAKPGEMIAVPCPPDQPTVVCRCTGCGPTTNVGCRCATRVAPHMEVCGTCRPYWVAKARRAAAQSSTEVIAASNVVAIPDASSQPQASGASHYRDCVVSSSMCASPIVNDILKETAR